MKKTSCLFLVIILFISARMLPPHPIEGKKLFHYKTAKQFTTLKLEAQVEPKKFTLTSYDTDGMPNVKTGTYTLENNILKLQPGSNYKIKSCGGGNFILENISEGFDDVTQYTTCSLKNNEN